jgi:hypothetical protein
MKSLFEEFAQMGLVTWLSVMAVALASTIVGVLAEVANVKWREFFVRSILAAFLAYMTALYCLEQEMSGRMMGVVVGFVTYQATNILTGLGRLGAAFAKDPIALAIKIKQVVKK